MFGDSANDIFLGPDKKKAYLSIIYSDKYKTHSKISIAVPYDCKWSFKLEPERSFVNMFKNFGLLKEVQIGDEEWDREVYILGDNPTIKDLFTRYPKLKTATLELIKNGISINFKAWSVDFTFTPVEAAKAETHWQQFIPAIETIMETLDQAKAEKLVPKVGPDNFLFGIFVMVIAFIGLSSIIYSSSITDERIQHLPGNMGFYGFVIGLMIGTSLLFIWRAVRRLHSRSHYEFFILFAVAPIAFAVAGSSYAFYMNRTLDQDTGTELMAIMTKKKIMRHKHGQSYIHHYEYNVPHEIKKTTQPAFIDLKVSSDSYDNIPMGDVISIKIYRGYFGQPWIKL